MVAVSLVTENTVDSIPTDTRGGIAGAVMISLKTHKCLVLLGIERVFQMENNRVALNLIICFIHILLKLWKKAQISKVLSSNCSLTSYARCPQFG